MGISFQTIVALPKAISHILPNRLTGSSTLKQLGNDVAEITSHVLDKQELKAFLKEVRKIYETEIVPELGLNKTNLSFSSKKKGILDGSYSYVTNQTNLSLDLLTNPKLVRAYGLSNDKLIPLSSFSDHMPMIVKDASKISKYEKELAETTGMEKIIGKPLTKDERKKMFLQMLYHEARHQHQTELMAKTEGIGIKKIIASNYVKVQKSKIIKLLKALEFKIWKPLKPFEASIPRNSELGQKAHSFFKALRKYPPTDNIEKLIEGGYYQNAMETDAFQFAHEAICKKMGEWT